MRSTCLVLAATLVVACTVTPGSTPTRATPTAAGSPRPVTANAATPSPTVMRSGDALALAGLPSAASCERRFRGDLAAARNIRASLEWSGTAIALDEQTITAAAADPAADLAIVGIPLRADDVAAVRESGMYLDARLPLSYWVNVGRQDLFGGIWIDPPGSESVVVSVVDGHAQGIELGRCLERDDLKVRYVFAERFLRGDACDPGSNRGR